MKMYAISDAHFCGEYGMKLMVFLQAVQPVQVTTMLKIPWCEYRNYTLLRRLYGRY